MKRARSGSVGARRLLRAVEPGIAAATLKTSQLLALQAFDVAVRAGSFKVAAATGKAFAELAREGTPAAGKAGRQRLRLKVLPMFGSAWLMPRLATFITRHPEIELALESSSRNADFDLEEYDAGISVGDGSFDGLTAHHLTDIRTTPIATPSLVRQLRLRKPADLRRAALIHVTAFPAAWPLWLRHAGVPKLESEQTISVD